MNRILKTGLVAGLLIAVLVFAGGCLPAAANGEEAQGGWESTWPMLAFLAVIFVFFWFVMIRPQRKRQKDHQSMMESLHKGDKVITAGGIYGTIDSLSEDSVIIKVEGGTTMRVARGSVAVVRDQ
ncbi:MAG: preprotein translocase subunit YajC [Dehalococcoidales bacterium]|nr:preprotein translocase subunit YajC [Dehalococcoidales bacterium]